MTDLPSQPVPSEDLAAVVIDGDQSRLLAPLSDVDAVALLGCATEDPACWHDLALVWSRHRFHEDSPEFLDSLPYRELDRNSALDALADTAGWVALDLTECRLFTGGELPRLRLRGTPVEDRDAAAEMVLLPPWWELHQHTAAGALRQRRTAPVVRPNPRRDVLWGPAVHRFFAGAMLQAIRSGKPWIGKDWNGNPCGRRDLTVEIHRDWLMTPCAELDGGIPRDLLHGAREWISDLSALHKYRVLDGADPIPISAEMSTYEEAPLGRHEVIMYFDACREALEAGWFWLLEDPDRLEDTQAEPKLAAAMDAAREQWLQSPFEGGQPPVDIIQCERWRIPLVDTGAGHVIDCDCPLCQMMADGVFGPAFCGFDGHHLELDDEFAFSLCTTREQWQAEQHEWQEINARIDANLQDRETQQSAEDDFSPVWGKETLASDAIPGDTDGQLGLGFLVTDIVGSLTEAQAAQSDLDQLNRCFRDYRRAAPGQEKLVAADDFKQTLEALAGKHQSLVSRCADLQSRIDELARAATSR